MIPVSYNLRSLMVRRTTSLATALGVGLVVFVLASSQMLSRGIKRTMAATGERDRVIVLRKGADAELSSWIDQRLVGQILSAPGVQKDKTGAPLGVGEVVVVIAMEKPGSNGQVANVQVRGVADNVFDVRSKVRLIDGRPLRPGTDEVMIGKGLRGQYAGMEIGQRFELNKNRPVTVVGVFEAGGSSLESEIFASVDPVRTAFGREAMVSSVTAVLESTSSLDAFAAAVESDKQLDVQVTREDAYYEKQSEGTAGLVGFLGAAIVFFFSVGAMIGAMITMYGAVANRQREIGTLRALGFRRRTILASFLLEALLLASAGGTVGAVASLAMGAVEIPMMNQNTWSEVVFTFEPAPDILLSSILVGGVMGLFGGLLPAVRAARVSPVVAMRS